MHRGRVPQRHPALLTTQTHILSHSFDVCARWNHSLAAVRAQPCSSSSQTRHGKVSKSPDSQTAMHTLRQRGAWPATASPPRSTPRADAAWGAHRTQRLVETKSGEGPHEENHAGRGSSDERQWNRRAASGAAWETQSTAAPPASPPPLSRALRHFPLRARGTSSRADPPLLHSLTSSPQALQSWQRHATPTLSTAQASIEATPPEHDG